ADPNARSTELDQLRDGGGGCDPARSDDRNLEHLGSRGYEIAKRCRAAHVAAGLHALQGDVIAARLARSACLGARPALPRRQGTGLVRDVDQGTPRPGPKVLDPA